MVDVAAVKYALAIACLGSAIAVAAGSCSGDEGGSASATDAGPDRPSSLRDSGGGEASSASDGGANGNPVDLTGWTPLTGFDSNCSVYLPPSPDKFPVPNAWQPCDARVHTADGGGALSCQQIADNWGAGGAPGLMPIGPVNSAYVDRATQSVTLPIARFTPNAILYVVADADGPMRQVVAATTSQCVLNFFVSIAKSDVIYEIDEFSTDLTTIVRTGAFGGQFGSPRILRNYPSTESLGYVAGGNEFFEFGSEGLDTATWSDGGKLDTLGTTAPGQIVEPSFQVDDLFFSVDDLTYGRVQHYAGDAGVTDFISFGNDTQSYAADFGTDGTDMVWSEAFGHANESAPWTTINIVTAPYTTNPASIVKRRLRSEYSSPGISPFTVGCGYAAHQFNDATQVGVRIVRISDGRSWRLAVNAGDPLAWTSAVAITCSEIFANFNFGSGKTNLARIRLDSLGPGDPAD